MARINFRTATTSEKLNHLANALEGRHKNSFFQWLSSDCIVGIGNELDGSGRRTHVMRRFTDDEIYFAKRYGITQTETHNLYRAKFTKMRVGATPKALRNKSDVEQAVIALRGLARRYAQRGN